MMTRGDSGLEVPVERPLPIDEVLLCSVRFD